MPGSGTRTFIDPDDYQASLRQAGIDLLVTSPGAFKARLTWAELDHLHLIRSQEELPRIAYLSLPQALSFVAFPTQSDPPPLWGGMELRSGDIMFHSRGERLHQRTRGPCFWSLITLAPRYLEDYGRAPSGRELVPPLPAESCGQPRGMRRDCSACIRRPVALPRRGPKPWGTPRLREAWNRN
jgi:hypothetical protein